MSKVKLYRKRPEINYCGSLIQQNHGESLEHGILVWDLESKSAEYVPIENDTAFFNSLVSALRTTPDQVTLGINLFLNSLAGQYNLKRD